LTQRVKIFLVHQPRYFGIEIQLSETFCISLITRKSAGKPQPATCILCFKEPLEMTRTNKERECTK